MPSLRIHWSPLALERVVEAAAYSYGGRPQAAEQYVQGVFASVERLKEFPESGRVVPELGRESTRELFFRRYRIIYRVERDRVEVLTVRHMRQLLEEEDVEG